MQLHPLKLVTIVTEPVLKDQILEKVTALGATGYTYGDVTGSGSRGIRIGIGGENVKIEIVCPNNVAEAILTFISHHSFENYACIAWVADVSVVRGSHYVK
jgi:nitrogen regulatory protein P-II 2